MNNENMISNKFGLNLERVISYIDIAVKLFFIHTDVSK